MKEKLIIRDIANGEYYPSEWEGFEVVQDKSIDSEIEYQSETRETVIRRKSDGKFFMFYREWYYHSDCYEDDFFDTEAEEVEQKTRIVTETYYE